MRDASLSTGVSTLHLSGGNVAAFVGRPLYLAKYVFCTHVLRTCACGALFYHIAHMIMYSPTMSVDYA